MLRIKNLITEVEYEAIKYEKYNTEQVNKCKRFITEKLDLCVRVIMPNLHIFDLEQYGFESVIKPTDYIIRTITDGIPLYNIVSQEIVESNFEVIE
ncbi:MAG: hypothetical protein IJA10_10770 [Lachnospiraceae bacterium]|nr:hypothetical protein [Lachnospiraceae bacterium]